MSHSLLIRAKLSCLAAVALLGLDAASPVLAQMQLPSASHSTARGQTTRGVPVKPPQPESVTRRELRLNGQQGLMVLDAQGPDLAVTTLRLKGESMSRRGEACEIDVAGGPFVARAAGALEGLSRFQVELPACPFTIEALDGAVQVYVGDADTSSPVAGFCAFQQADCKAYVAGIWGPSPRSFSSADLRQIERARAKAEANARANFRALIAAAGRDRDRARVIAAEQAGFSSRRAERCFDYAAESEHGFCASRVTQARATALRARLDRAASAVDVAPPKSKAKPRKAKPRHKKRRAPHRR